MNSPDGNTMAAAEHTIALMLAMARNIAPAATSTKEGKWDRSKFTGCELYKKVLGVIGFGKIGTHVAEVALALGMKVVVYDPYTSKEIVEKVGGERVDSLDDFWGVCDCDRCLNIEGKNKLGELLMKVRDELRKERGEV